VEIRSIIFLVLADFCLGGPLSWQAGTIALLMQNEMVFCGMILFIDSVRWVVMDFGL